MAQASDLGHAVGDRSTDAVNVTITTIGSPTDPSIAHVVKVEGIRTHHFPAPGDALLAELKRVVEAPETGWVNRLEAIHCSMLARAYPSSL